MAQDRIVSLEVQQVGSIIEEARKKKELSLRELGQKVGCSATHITRIEQGIRKGSPDILYNICRVLGLPTNQVVGVIYPCINKIGNVNNIKNLFPIIQSDEEAKLIEEIISELVNTKLTRKEYELIKYIIKVYSH